MPQIRATCVPGFKSLKNASSKVTPWAVLNRATARTRTSGAAIDKPLNNRHNQESCQSITKMLKTLGNTRGGSSPQGTVSAFRDEANTPTCLTRDSSLQRFCPTSRSKAVSRSLTQCGSDTGALQGPTRALGSPATAKAIVHISTGGCACVLVTLEHQTDNGRKRMSLQVSASHTHTPHPHTTRTHTPVISPVFESAAPNRKPHPVHDPALQRANGGKPRRPSTCQGH